MSQELRLFLKDKPEGNQVLGNCNLNDDLCWKDFPLLVTKEKTIKEIHVRDSSEYSALKDKVTIVGFGLISIALFLALLAHYKIMRIREEIQQ